MINAIGNYIGRKPQSAVSIPDPDALFDTRSGLTITDSVGGLTANIKSFPYYLNGVSTAGLVLKNIELLYTPASGDLTAIYFIRPQQGTTNYSDIRGIADYGNNYMRIYNSTKSCMFYMNGTNKPVTFPNNANYTTKLYMLVYKYDEANTLATWRVYDSSANYAGTTQVVSHHAAATYGLTLANTATGATMGFVKSLYYTRQLNDSELSGVWNGTIPVNNLISYTNHCIGESTIAKCYDSIADKEWLIVDASGNQPVSPYYLRDDFSQLADALTYGYTKRGLYQIAYTPSSTKGITGAVGDIEHTSLNCIHNLADSRIYFDAVTDATIKAIFDKSNSTYWNASIQAESHYIDAGGGYYGVWHPSQLNRTFIEAHAKAGHENHIFPGLKSTSGAVTGITEIVVYKSNI